MEQEITMIIIYMSENNLEFMHKLAKQFVESCCMSFMCYFPIKYFSIHLILEYFFDFFDSEAFMGCFLAYWVNQCWRNNLMWLLLARFCAGRLAVWVVHGLCMSRYDNRYPT